jgi:clan AA aspartic protease
MAMGLTCITLRIANPAFPKKSLPVEFLVDSGAVYSVVPSSILRKLNIKPHSKQVFTLADGSHITRRKGDVLFQMDGKKGAAPVIFGEKGDSTLLGAVTLEALGVILDPIRRELRPLPMILAGASAVCAETVQVRPLEEIQLQRPDSGYCADN